MVVLTETGSTGAQGYPPGRPCDAPRDALRSGGARHGLDRPPVLGRVHELGALRRLAVQRAAQLADQALAAGGDVEVHALPDQRIPMAIVALRAAGSEGPDAAAQQGDL